MTGENIPVFTSVTFDEKESSRGGNVESTVALLEGLRWMPWESTADWDRADEGILKDILEVTSLPVMVNPNAGLQARTGNGL